MHSNSVKLPKSFELIKKTKIQNFLCEINRNKQANKTLDMKLIAESQLFEDSMEIHTSVFF